jgi:glycosidase
MVKADGGKSVGVDMIWAGIKGSCDVFECKYKASGHGLYFYWFEIGTLQGNFYICRDSKGTGKLYYDKKELFQLSVFDPDFTTPDWLKGGVMYQIFPDRFCRQGDFPDNLPTGRELLENWGELPLQIDSKYFGNLYFGGNFKGIVSKLPYLKSLGITVIYLNPIFESHSNHRYHTADYMKIDPLLGRTEDFEELCADALQYGIRIIIDGVFSHTGADSVYFNRYGRYSEPGAYQTKQSKYFEWYDFDCWPDKYRCWWNIIDLPEVNEETPSYKSFITGESGVVEHWLNCGASGWRLDVADELPDKFIESLRERVKLVDPQAVVIGEVWEDASNKVSYSERRHYFEGGQLDSVMNYPWRNAVLNFIRTGNAEDITEPIMTILENYPKQCVDVLMNHLGSHDTERLITGLAGENSTGRGNLWKQSTQLKADQHVLGIVLEKLACAIQFFLPGVPCVYYGDEAGAEGYGDPFNRQCFPWGREDINLFEWYRSLSEQRSACPAMKQGGYRQIEAQGGLFIFARTDENGEDAVVCAVNADDKNVKAVEKLTLGARICLSCGGVSLDGGILSLSAKSCAIIGIGQWSDEFMNQD